jgi:hypothetical protein
LWGIPRSTKDADFVVQLDQQSIAAVTSTLGPEFQLDPQMSFETVTGTLRYRIRRSDSAFMVEFFLLGQDAHDRARFARRVLKPMGDHHAFVATAEDVIITKLRWSRGANRAKDIEDIKDVLEVQTSANLELPYIRGWCDQHGTRELFEQLLAQTDAA